MALSTSTNYNLGNIKAVHIGNMSVSGSAVVPATAIAPSVGDIVLLAKIPHGAVVVDFFEDHTCADTAGLDFGFNTGIVAGGTGNLSALIAAGAKSTFNRRNVVTAGNGGQGITISLSDLDPNRFAQLTAKVASGSLTSQVTINWTCIYRLDGLPG